MTIPGMNGGTGDLQEGLPAHHYQYRGEDLVMLTDVVDDIRYKH